MTTSFFFLALVPSNTELPFIYSKSFSIQYADTSDLRDKQNEYDMQFRTYNGNPSNYNSSWSAGYKDSSSANKNRRSQIDSLVSSGKIVEEPDWPD